MAWNASFKFIIQAVDEASEPLREISEAVEETKGRFEGLSDVMKAAAGVMIGEIAHDAVNQLVEGCARAGEAFMDLEWTLKTIVAASGETGEAAEQLYSQLSEVAHAQEDLGFSAVEAAKALESLVKAGLSGEEAANALRSALQMARIENISTAEASDMLVGIMNQFGYVAADSAKVVDALVNASVAGVDTAGDFALALSYCGAQAASMGLSLEETLAALVALNNQGIAAEKAGRYLGSMLQDLVEHSDKLGFSIYDVNGNLLPFFQIIGYLNEKLRSFGSQAERDAYIAEVFGSQSQRAALSLLNLGDETTSAADMFIQLQMAMGKTGTSAQLTSELMDTLRGQLMQSQAAAVNNSEAFGQMSAQVNVFWNQLSGLMGPLTSVTQSLGPSMLQGAISGVTMMLPSLIGQLGGLGGALSAVQGAFSAFLGVLMANPIGLVVVAVAALAGALWWVYNNCEPFRNAVDAVGKALGEGLGKAIEAVKGALEWVWNNVLKPLADFLWAVFQPALKAVADAIYAVTHPLETLTNIGKGVMDWLGGVKEALFGSPQTIFEDAAEGIKKLKREMRGLSLPTIGGLTVGVTAPGTVAATPIIVNFNVQGSVDRRTAEYAVELMKKKLGTVLIESTSSAAPTRRIRVTRR